MSVTPPVVPYVRKLDLWDSGDDVIAVKRALSRAGYIRWGEFTRHWGPFAVQSCKRFQRAKGLKQTGEYTFATHEALRKTHRKGSRVEWAYDRYSISVMKQEDVSPYDRKVSATLDAVTYAIVNRDRMNYAQIRPMPDNAPYPNIPNPCDCSQFVTWAARSGGWTQDPNYPVGSGRKWDGYGYTGTLWSSGAAVPSLSAARLCDLVFYGTPWMAGGAAHVVMLREFYGGNWYAGSMGSSSGPHNLRADYRRIIGIRRYVI